MKMSAARSAMVRATVLALVSFFLTVQVGAALEQPIVDRPKVNPGDVFEYADRFETVACKRWVVEDVDSDGATTSRCGDNTAYFDADGAIIRIVGRNGKDLVKFKPKASAIPFPLSVGKTWTNTFDVSTAVDIVSPTITETCEVTAFESIRVGAGDMAAFRIDCTEAWSIGLLAGKSSSRLWFAPAAKAVVKDVSTGDDKWNFELEGYSFRDQPSNP